MTDQHVIGVIVDALDAANPRMVDQAEGIVAALLAAGYDIVTDPPTLSIDPNSLAEGATAALRAARCAIAALHAARYAIVTVPSIPFKGPNDTDVSLLRGAAARAEGGYPVGGGNVSRAVAKLLLAVADEAENEGRDAWWAEHILAALRDKGAIIEDPPLRAIDADHLAHQREWSQHTFGPGRRTEGLIDHITKELGEIRDNPTDLKEWVDVILLSFDGAWRAGWEPQQVIDAIVAKQAENERRIWPDWRTTDPEKAIQHVRSPAETALDRPLNGEGIIDIVAEAVEDAERSCGTGEYRQIATHALRTLREACAVIPLDKLRSDGVALIELPEPDNGGPDADGQVWFDEYTFRADATGRPHQRRIVTDYGLGREYRTEMSPARARVIAAALWAAADAAEHAEEGRP